MGSSIVATAVSLLVGGAAAAATVIGLVDNETSAPDKSPVNVTEEIVVDYGTN